MDIKYYMTYSISFLIMHYYKEKEIASWLATQMVFPGNSFALDLEKLGVLQFSVVPPN